jgi:hypothetical protein
MAMITRKEIEKYKKYNNASRAGKLNSLRHPQKFADSQSAFCPILFVAIQCSALVGGK